MSRTIVTRARIEGLVILAVASGYLWETRNIPTLFQSPGVPGPAAFPALAGGAFALAGLWRVIRGEPAAARAEDASAEPPAAHGGGGLGALARGWRFYALWVTILGFLALMPVLGFPVAAPIALAVLFVLLGETRPQVVVGLALGAAVVMYFGFAKGLGVKLPLGVLQGLLG